MYKDAIKQREANKLHAKAYRQRKGMTGMTAKSVTVSKVIVDQALRAHVESIEVKKRTALDVLAGNGLLPYDLCKHGNTNIRCPKCNGD